MRRNIPLCEAACLCIVIAFAASRAAMSQEHSKLVDTGVIFSAKQVESWRLRGEGLMDFYRLAPPPYWTPVPEEIALLEGKLKPYLESATPPAAKIIATRLGKYKRQYVGYTYWGTRWIFVSGFCEQAWKESDAWHDSLGLWIDGGMCFFTVGYDVSRSQFEHLRINNSVTGRQ
jgi:hypothetical protein